MRRYARVTRNTVSPDVAEELTRILWQTDVRSILPNVQAPTALVIGEGDTAAEVEEAEYVASLMPNANVHVLSGRSGLQREAFMEIIRGLAGVERRQAVSTMLVTVLFTDIVDSTRRQAALGDRARRELVLAHHAVVRDALARWEAPSTTRPATASTPASPGLRVPFTARTRSPNGSAHSASRRGPRFTSESARSSMGSPAALQSRSAPASSESRTRERSSSPRPLRTSSRAVDSPSPIEESANSRASRTAGGSMSPSRRLLDPLTGGRRTPSRAPRR